MLAKNHLFFRTRPHPPTASAATATDRVREQVGHARHAQQLHDNRGRHGLLHPQKGVAAKGNAFASHKYTGKSALRYKLGIDILAGNLVWIQGPYPAGKYTDIKIFNKVLRNFLEPGERVEADEGYRGHPDKIKCPGNDANPAENRGMQGRARARHETLNGWLKNWGILSQVYRHDIMRHGDVFRACAVLTQLTVENGELLFEVEYAD